VGAFAFVDGVTALWAAITDRMLVQRGWVAFWGLTGVAAGVVTFLWPSITATALGVVIATWAFLVGGSRIARAISTREQLHGAWAIALGGIALVLLGAVLLLDPGAGAMGVTWAVGWLAVVVGGTSCGSHVSSATRPVT
jgi:uncharacterized membrane protein HdeD (DUF308 family)